MFVKLNILYTFFILDWILFMYSDVYVCMFDLHTVIMYSIETVVEFKATVL